MRSVLAYTASRLLLFAVTWGVVYLLGARGLLAAALAWLISGLVSYRLLSGQRDRMSAVLARGIARMRGVRKRLDEGATKEDSGESATGASAADPSPPTDPDAVPNAPAAADTGDPRR